MPRKDITYYLMPVGDSKKKGPDLILMKEV
jgi:hypothetical protein